MNRFIFATFKNAEDAAYAQAAMNGHPFDAKHTFHINRFTDVEKYANMDETWVEPEPEPYKPKVGFNGHMSRSYRTDRAPGTSPCMAW